MIFSLLDSFFKPLLKLKAWQVFTITLALYAVNTFWLDQLILAYILSIFLFGWYWTVARVSLNFLNKNNHNIDTSFFYKSCIFVGLYLATALILTDGKGYFIDKSNIDNLGNWSYLIIPLHIVCTVLLMYIIYFIAKLVASAKENKLVSRDKSLDTFAALYFFPIGIWIIHPIIQEIEQK